METPSKQKWLWIVLLGVVIGDGYAQDGYGYRYNTLDDFYDYYDNLDGTGGLPDDYKELYDYYNYYNEKDEEPTKTDNSNGRSAPTDDVVEAAYEQGSHHNEERREWEGYGGEVDRRTEETDRHHYSYPNPSGTEKSENQPNSSDNKDNEKDDAEWRRELIYKTYREQLDAYNKLIREEHAARFVTETTAATTTTTTSATRRTTQSPLDSEGTCRDSDSRCERWGLNGWCGLWKSITQVYCKQTCGFCDGMAAPCADDADVVSYCKSWKNNGDCESDYDYMFQRCPSTCDFCDEKGLKLAKRR